MLSYVELEVILAVALKQLRLMKLRAEKAEKELGNAYMELAETHLDAAEVESALFDVTAELAQTQRMLRAYQFITGINEREANFNLAIGIAAGMAMGFALGLIFLH